MLSVSVNLGAGKGLVRTHATSPGSPLLGAGNFLLCASSTVRQGKAGDLLGLPPRTTMTHTGGSAGAEFVYVKLAVLIKDV